jgi:hypothetical protein
MLSKRAIIVCTSCWKENTALISKCGTSGRMCRSIEEDKQEEEGEDGISGLQSIAEQDGTSGLQVQLNKMVHPGCKVQLNKRKLKECRLQPYTTNSRRACQRKHKPAR